MPLHLTNKLAHEAFNRKEAARQDERTGRKAGKTGIS